MKLGVSGIKGSFSEEAGKTYLMRENLEAEIAYCLDMEGVLRELDAGQIDMGIFPVTNSVGGLVETAFEAMGKYPFELVDKLSFEVNQCLLALPGMTKEYLTQITSHPQAITQCKQYLQKHFTDLKLQDWSDTASAARDLANGTLPKTAGVLAPKSSEAYGLVALEKGIQDQHPNLTTFIIVKKLST